MPIIPRLPLLSQFNRGVVCAWSAIAAACILGAGAQPAVIACASPLPAAPLATTEEDRFFLTYADDAVESQESTGVPASVTLAQAALESDWGRSLLTRDAKNFFGIKAHGKQGTAGVVMMPTWEVIQGVNRTVQAAFRAYHTAAESFIDHGLFFLENPRYAPALAVKHDARAFAHEIAKAGYATDPEYAPKLIRLMDRHDLYRFDAVPRSIELARATVNEAKAAVEHAVTPPPAPAPTQERPGPEKLLTAVVSGPSESVCGD